MKTETKKVIKEIVFWIFVIAYLVVALSFTTFRKSDIVCSGINVHVKTTQDTIVDESVVKDIILANQKNIIGDKLSHVDLAKLEEVAKSYPAVKAVEMYKTFNNAESKGLNGGSLNMDIKQREPIARIYTDMYDNYIDNEGFLMPLQDVKPCRIIVVSGSVDKNTVKTELLQMLIAINNDKFLKETLSQIYIDSSQSILMYSTLSDHEIVFGGFEDYDKKLKKLKALYTKGLKGHDWYLYREINLKFKGLIVCKKKKGKDEELHN